MASHYQSILYHYMEHLWNGESFHSRNFEELKLQHQTTISEIRQKAAIDIVNLENNLQTQKDNSEEAYDTIVEKMEQLQESHDKLQGTSS